MRTPDVKIGQRVEVFHDGRWVAAVVMAKVSRAGEWSKFRLRTEAGLEVEMPAKRLRPPENKSGDTYSARELFAVELEAVWRDLAPLAQGKRAKGGHCPDAAAYWQDIEGGTINDRPVQGRLPRELVERVARVRAEIRAIAQEADPTVCRPKMLDLRALAEGQR